MNSHAKEQLIQCVKDLALRAAELKQNDLAICLFVVHTAALTDTTNELGHICETFAKNKMAQFMEEENAKADGNNLDNPETPDKV